MADRLVFVAGSPADLARAPFVPHEMIEDLRAISEIPAGQIEAVAATLGGKKVS